VTGGLPAPLQDPSSAALPDGRVILLGGLTAADGSTDSVLVADASGAREVGRLPSARHDTAAAVLGRFAYVFGGGTATSQLDEIVRIDPANGRAMIVGHLPAASSDSAAAAIAGTIYVVGGYTGTRWLEPCSPGVRACQRGLLRGCRPLCGTQRSRRSPGGS